jgi:membrane-associated phospholipid phosphatase
MIPSSSEAPAAFGSTPLRSSGLLVRLLVAAGLACLGGLLLPVDIPVSAWCRTRRLPGDLGRLIDLSEVFGHAFGAAAILGVTATLDPVLRQARRLAAARWDLGRLVIATYAGGLLIVDVLKLAVDRVRPRAAEFASISSVFDTFGTSVWRAAGEPDVATKLGKAADLMSFPSGHAAVAAGLATALAWKYPHGLPVFVALAAASAIQRVASSAHYPSDVAFGAACGVAAAAICLGVSGPAGPPMAAEPPP